MMRHLCFLFLLLTSLPLQAEKTVLLSVIARNKAHLLPKYLQCLERLDYDKKKITLLIQTYNNTDGTKEILQQWAKEHEEAYQKIHFESRDDPAIPMQKTYFPVQCSREELQMLAELKHQVFCMAEENRCDFCFLLDCDALIAPCTLKQLMEKEKPVIAPMLRAIPGCNDLTSTFFCDTTESGYYEDHPDYLKILFHWMVGTFKVPFVYRAMLIQSDYFGKLHYTNNTSENDHIVFGRLLRELGIEQYVCNESQFGVMTHFYNRESLDDERLQLQTLLMIP